MLDSEWASKQEEMEGQEFPVLILKKKIVVQIYF